MNDIHRFDKQQGATLIIVLVFMVILAMVSLSTMHSSSFEIKVARSVKSQVDALTAAENALQIGEEAVCSNQLKPNSCNGGFTTNFDAVSNDGLYLDHTVDLTADNKNLAHFINNIAQQSTSDANESYVIEYLGIINTAGESINVGQSGADKRYLFRITGYGKAPQGGAKLIQSHFATSD